MQARFLSWYQQMTLPPQPYTTWASRNRLRFDHLPSASLASIHHSTRAPPVQTAPDRRRSPETQQEFRHGSGHGIRQGGVSSGPHASPIMTLTAAYNLDRSGSPAMARRSR